MNNDYQLQEQHNNSNGLYIASCKKPEYYYKNYRSRSQALTHSQDSNTLNWQIFSLALTSSLTI